jgi:hypothetical protein
MRLSVLSLLAAASVTTAQLIGKVALCNNCWQLGSGFPTCSDNNYIHWGEESDQGDCNDGPSVFDGPCEADPSSNIDTPLGSGPVRTPLFDLRLITNGVIWQLVHA